jgi:hypothetical protein
VSIDSNLDVARHHIELLMRLIVARRGSAYRAGRRIWGISMGHAPECTELMWPMWLLWGALTDWVEKKPEETAEAEAAMRRVSAEWLSLPNSSEARHAYFDRWLYQEMGYERPDTAP